MQSAVRASPYALGFTSLDNQVDHVRLSVKGVLPPWLNGSLIRTAPAKFEVGKNSYRHWFDGLAMLHAFSFRDGEISHTSRFLESRSYREAEEHGRIARREFMTDPCRTLFGRVAAFFSPKQTDNANVNVTVLAGKMVALTETPMPIQFDPHSLATIGASRFPPGISGQVSTAHPHSDGERSYSYVIAMGAKSKYRLYVDESATQRVLAEFAAPEPAYMHSLPSSADPKPLLTSHSIM